MNKHGPVWSHEIMEHGQPAKEILSYDDVARTLASYPDPRSKLAKREEGYPDDNPKTSIGATKVPLHLVLLVALHYTALAFADGAKKYGPYNWRERHVSSSVYVGAALRHLNAFWDGEDVSSDAGVHHLGHVMACCAIMLDGMSIGMLNDDRPPPGAAGKLQLEYSNNNNKNKESAIDDATGKVCF